MGSPCFTQGVHLEYLESFKEGCSVIPEVLGRGFSVGGLKGTQTEASRECNRTLSTGQLEDLQGAQLDISRGCYRRFEGVHFEIIRGKERVEL